MTEPLIIIPSRMNAVRLPNKPLADIGGKPMIARMVERALAANIGRIIVATDHQDIADIAEKEGAVAVMTDPDLPSGTDRVWAAASQIDPEGKHEIIVNLQGDMPTFKPEIINQTVDVLKHQPQSDISTLVALITTEEEKNTDAVVKAIVSWQSDQLGRGLYFTRATAPSSGDLWHHLGIYAYRREAIKKFVTLPPSPLEKQERLEQLRALEAGMIIGIGKASEAPLGVDTQETLELARKQFKEL